MPKPAKSDAQTPPDVERHDEVYFRHKSGGPRVGRVLSRGAHGCTVDADGERHQVRWDGLLGHKTRVRPDVKVVDQGEDGMLVEDPAGRRRFVQDPMGVIEPGAPSPMRKALRPTVLLFTNVEGLSKALTGRPGLTLQDVTDKAGRRTKRWKKTGQAAPKGRKPAAADPEAAPKPKARAKGESVKFKLGEAEGSGKIVGTPGEHGAHVQDSTGHQHQVLWDQMSDHEEAAEPAQAKPAAKDAGAKADTANLPRATVQPHATWEELSANAPEALEQLGKALGGVAQKLGLRTDARPKDIDGGSSDGFLFIGKLKDAERAKQKVEADYDGDWSQLRDLVRATIAVPNMASLEAARAAVEAAGLKLAQRPKDRFARPTEMGYRDLLTVVELPNGMLAELQYHLTPITAAKAASHKSYVTTRSLQAKYGEDAPSESWAPEDHAAFYDAMKDQKGAYDAAWAQASKTA